MRDLLNLHVRGLGAYVQELLAPLRGLGRTGMENLLSNWYRGVKGRFKVPIFAHQELDLYRVFWAVVDRGGNDHVTFNKQWKVGGMPFLGCPVSSVRILCTQQGAW